MTHIRYENLLIFCAVAVAVWFLVIYLWPRIFLNVYKRAVLTKGFEGPIPINTLATEPHAIFADPLHPPASATKLATELSAGTFRTFLRELSSRRRMFPTV